MDPEILRSSFRRVVPLADRLALRFYERLFTVYPQVRPLFGETDMDEQRRKLVATLAAVVAAVDRGEELEAMLARLGGSHEGYGVQAGHYPYVCACLLATLAQELGDDWTAEVAGTWAAALELVSERMIEAQRQVA